MSERPIKPWTERQQRFARPVIKVMSSLNTWIYRLSGGRIWGKWLQGGPILLLTTVGRRSGRAHTTPLLYLREGDDIVIVASKGGMPRHPDWFLNLEADANVEVEIGADRTLMKARRASVEEKKTLWPRLVAMYSDYADYQARTTRDIPVVILSSR